ncbi:GTPase [Aureococcus anophagefferens]|nr:GTPase [Aureococcus anophagefferens]
MASGRPLQLIRCGDDTDNYAFTLNEAHLDEVTGKVPKGTRVAVVSVVGAFRTGKSFLLTLILRPAPRRAPATGDATDAWLTEEGNKIVEGNNNAGDAGEGGPASFEWRGGRVRMTTGITVWSEPFLGARSAADEARRLEAWVAALAAEEIGAWELAWRGSRTTTAARAGAGHHSIAALAAEAAAARRREALEPPSTDEIPAFYDDGPAPIVEARRCARALGKHAPEWRGSHYADYFEGVDAAGPVLPHPVMKTATDVRFRR